MSAQQIQSPAIHFTFNGEPIPASRPRITRRGTFTPQAYRQYKTRLATALRSEFGHLMTIPAPGDKKRSAYLKTHRYRLEIIAYRSNHRPVDADNISKSILDALQDAGILANDAQVDELFCRKCVDKASPRVEIWLEQLPPTPWLKSVWRSFTQTYYGLCYALESKVSKMKGEDDD